MFRFSEDSSYLMPAHFGGSPLGSWMAGGGHNLAAVNVPVQEYTGAVVTVGSQVIRVENARELPW